MANFKHPTWQYGGSLPNLGAPLPDPWANPGKTPTKIPGSMSTKARDEFRKNGGVIVFRRVVLDSLNIQDLANTLRVHFSEVVDPSWDNSGVDPNPGTVLSILDGLLVEINHVRSNVIETRARLLSALGLVEPEPPCEIPDEVVMDAVPEPYVQDEQSALEDAIDDFLQES